MNTTDFNIMAYIDQQIPADETKAWGELDTLSKNLNNLNLKNLFKTDPSRADRYSIKACNLYLDYSKNLVTDKILTELNNLANQRDLAKSIALLFNGEKINSTENRSVLHVALRAIGKNINIDGV